MVLKYISSRSSAIKKKATSPSPNLELQRGEGVEKRQIVSEEKHRGQKIKSPKTGWTTAHSLACCWQKMYKTLLRTAQTPQLTGRRGRPRRPPTEDIGRHCQSHLRLRERENNQSLLDAALTSTTIAHRPNIAPTSPYLCRPSNAVNFGRRSVPIKHSESFIQLRPNPRQLAGFLGSEEANENGLFYSIEITIPEFHHMPGNWEGSTETKKSSPLGTC